MKNKLTEEQKEILENNIGLLRKYCKNQLLKGVIPEGYEPEFIGELEERFCSIIKTFDESREVKLSTYAYIGFGFATKEFFRKLQKVRETSLIPKIYGEIENSRWNSVSGFGEEHLNLEKLADLIDETELTKREIICIQSYYYDGLFLREVGEIYNLTAERIRQIIKEALDKIRLRALKQEYTEEEFYIEKR